MMTLKPLDKRYAKSQIKWHHHNFTKPTPQRSYIKLLKIIASEEFYPTAKISEAHAPTGFVTAEENPSRMWLPMLEAKGFIDHYADGSKTYWKITESGYALIGKAYAKA